MGMDEGALEWKWMVVDGCEWMFMDVDVAILVDVDGRGWVWINVDVFGWSDVDGCGWIWVHVDGAV
jgi:hypothetical protein